MVALFCLNVNLSPTRFSQSLFCYKSFLVCCEIIHVALNGSVKDLQWTTPGTYHLNGTINHRDYWVSDDGTRALWYLPTSKDWLFGSVENLGSGTGAIYSNNDLASLCPYDERHTYKYWNGSIWIDTEDVHQSCVTKG